MGASPDSPQRIARLTPLAQAVASIDRLVAPVAPRRVRTGDALGHTLATDVVAPGACPAAALALRDGIAVRAEATLDAGAYAPVALTGAALALGDPMPPGADAVAPLDAIETRGTSSFAVAALSSGDGVLPPGADAAPGDPLCRAGTRLRGSDLAALAILGVDHVEVRAPRIRVVSAHPRGDRVIDAIAGMLARAIQAGGGSVAMASPEHAGLDGALAGADDDAVIVIGGSGGGPRDRSVHALARRDRVAFHGVGLAPGETAAFGMVAARPVLIVPGRLDAALAVWLTLGRRMLARLCGRADDDPAEAVALTRKIASGLGLCEIVPVVREAAGVAPLASGYLPLAALARADGYVIVPADSEGYPAGARVEMRPLP